jgi:hypothetical protein
MSLKTARMSQPIRMLKPADHGNTAPTTANLTVDLTAATVKGFNAVMIALHVGTITGTSIACKLQESASDFSGSDVTGAAFTTITTSNDDTVRYILVDLQKITMRYIKLAFTFTAITVSPLSAEAIFFDAQDSELVSVAADAVVA